MGAMVFGQPHRERVQFNEETLWTGIPRDYQHPGAAQHLPEIRRLLKEGQQAKAESLAMDHFMSVPLRQERYQPLGDLWLTLSGHENVRDYRRELDLDSGIVTIRYRVGVATFTPS